MDGNFAARYDARLDKYDADIRDAKTERVRRETETAMNKYILQCVPFIAEYTTQTGGDESSQGVVNTLFNVNMRASGGVNKSAVYRDYMKTVENRVVPDKTPVVPDPAWITTCPECDSSDVRRTTDFTVCVECGACSRGAPEIPIGFNEQRDIDGTPQYSYKRENHFNEWINQFQGQESTTVSDEIIDQLKNEFKKAKVPMAGITHTRVRGCLKKLKLNKYYEHAPYITTCLHGTPPPRMDAKLEDKLRCMFHAIQKPFQNHCPSDRKNFLSYSYVLYKFCELLGEDEFLACFPLLKSKDKLHQQDVIWQKMCRELRWEYIATV